jgi:hypothetical protein
MFNRPAASSGHLARDPHPIGTRWMIASLLFFAGMTVLHTWPLASGRDSRRCSSTTSS